LGRLAPPINHRLARAPRRRHTERAGGFFLPSTKSIRSARVSTRPTASGGSRATRPGLPGDRQRSNQVRVLPRSCAHARRCKRRRLPPRASRRRACTATDTWDQNSWCASLRGRRHDGRPGEVVNHAGKCPMIALARCRITPAVGWERVRVPRLAGRSRRQFPAGGAAARRRRSGDPLVPDRHTNAPRVLAHEPAGPCR
jgi:hypothetical protein